MLHIVGSMKTLKGELQSADGLLRDIIGALELVTPETNLTKAVGIFVIQMPDYKVLTRDSEDAKQVLRKVCSGELSPSDAAIRFRIALTEVEQLREMLKNPNFLK